MKIKKNALSVLSCLVVTSLLTTEALAHDPVFGIGPHTLYKGGFEVHLGTHKEQSGDERASEVELQLKYGITADWVAGVGIPYARNAGPEESDLSRGATSLSTKYRFWRNDLPGAQAAAAALGKVILDDGESGHHGQARRDGNDYLVGLTYGYEGRKWYRWASARHRFNSYAVNGVERPDITLVDLVAGVRFTPTEYHEPDWVWMLELNGEITEHVRQLSEITSREQGGNQWFLSPGLMWTYRNFAFKAGVQLPIFDDFSGDQEANDYRAIIELEWHL